METNPRQRPSQELFEWDDQVNGLARRVRPSGRATWVVQWRLDGRTLRRTLGGADQLTREAARAAARRLKGINTPSPAMPTVAAFAAIALRDCAGRWKPGTLQTHGWCVRRIAGASLGALPVDQVTRQHVATWLADEQGDAWRRLAVLSFVMQHAELKGHRSPGSKPATKFRASSAHGSALVAIGG